MLVLVGRGVLIVRWPVVIGSVVVVVLLWPLVARVGVRLARVVVRVVGLRKRERVRGVMNGLTNGGSEWCGNGEFIIELSIFWWLSVISVAAGVFFVFCFFLSAEVDGSCDFYVDG